MKKPSFFIVGAPKSGTTAMYYYLKSHPNIFMPPYNKEPHYFANDLHQSVEDKKPRHWTTDLNSYLDLFIKMKPTQIGGEASVYYLFSSKAAKNIFCYNPDSKIIIMLRRPTEMTYSLFFEQLYAGLEKDPYFYTAFKNRSGEMGSFGGIKNSDGVFASYRELPLYYEQVKRYYDIFPHKNIYVIVFDDFQINTENIYREALRFLKVDESFKPIFRVINKSRKPRSRLFKSLLDSRPPFIINIFRRIIPKIIRHRIYHYLAKFSDRNMSRTPLKPDFEITLINYFCSDIQKLSKLVNKDLSHWLKPNSFCK